MNTTVCAPASGTIPTAAPQRLSLARGDTPPRGAQAPARGHPSLLWMDQLRVAAAFAVVWLHVSAAAVTMRPCGTADWMAGNVANALVRWCVPVFVMISGALLLHPTKNDALAVFYRKRLSRLLLPLLFWTACYVVWDCAGRLLIGRPAGLSGWLPSLLAGRPHYHLWYLYMLTGLYLFAPFIQRAVMNLRPWETAVLCAALLLYAALDAVGELRFGPRTQLFTRLFVPYLGYFVLGYLARSTTYRVPTVWLLGIFLAAATGTAVGTYWLMAKSGGESATYFHSYCSLTTIPQSVAVFFLLRQAPIRWLPATLLPGLVSASFGIYLVHPMVLDVLRFAGLSAATVNPLLSIPVVSVVAFGCSAVAVWTVKRIPGLRHVV